MTHALDGAASKLRCRDVGLRGADMAQCLQLQLPRLSPFGTGAPAWCGDSGRRAEIVPSAVFSGGALRLALKREAGWQERPLVVLGPLESAVAKFAGASKPLRARGGEGM
jgi:hypothetical protein